MLNSRTFNPGVWQRTGSDYQLINSSYIRYNQLKYYTNDGDHACQKVTLSSENRFTAPANSVIGFYSNFASLLHEDANPMSMINAYQYEGHQTFVAINSGVNVNYNIAIKLHLSKCY